MTSDDWWSVWVGLAFLGCLYPLSLVTGPPELSPWTTEPWRAFDERPSMLIWVLVPSMGLLTALSLRVRGKSTDGFLSRGFPLIAALTLLSKVLGAQTRLHGVGLGAAVWALLLGALVANVVFCGRRPAILKATLSNGLEEFWIKIGLVLLAIDFESVLHLGYHGLVLAYCDTLLVLGVTYLIGSRAMGLDPRLSLITAAALAICGTSAASAVASALAVPTESQMTTTPIAVMSLLTVPCIVALPPLGAALGLSLPVVGAWIGGSVDTTGAVIASASIAGPGALQTAAVVKMLQNTLICFVALGAAALAQPQPPPHAQARDPASKATSETVLAPRSVFAGPAQLMAAGDDVPISIPTADLAGRERAKTLAEAATAAAAARNAAISDPAAALAGAQRPAARNAAVSPPSSASVASAATSLPTAATSCIAVGATDVAARDSSSRRACNCFGSLWSRFPKFTLGFLLTSIILSFAAPEDRRAAAEAFSFSISEWFSTLGFVGIGLNLRLAELFRAGTDGRPSQEVSTWGVIALYSIGQTLDLIVTAVVAWISFASPAS